MHKRLFHDFLISKDLNDSIKSLKGDLKSKQRALDAIQNNCEHPIIAMYDATSESCIDAKCIICQKKFHTQSDLYDATPPYILDFYNSKLGSFSKEKIDKLIYSKLNNSYMKMNPYPTAKEMYEVLRELL